jgi:putative transcriptional regulator
VGRFGLVFGSGIRDIAPMDKRDFPKVKIYSPAQIKTIRKGLGDTREQFSRRFLVSPETIKGWETGRRNPQGPALVIMQQVERLVVESTEKKNSALDRLRNGNRCRMEIKWQEQK